MALDRYRMQVMDRPMLDIALDWAAQEGWNPGLCDGDCFFAADRTGFLMGFLDGRPVSSISAVKYSNDFGFIGLYIVEVAQRGRGLGIAIWNEAMVSLRGRIVGLDGVISQQENYRKSGFEFAHRNIRFTGVASSRNLPCSQIVDLQTMDSDLIRSYDLGHFPARRGAFLRAWMRQPGSHALGWKEGGVLLGMGCVRPCREGYKVGPLNADSAEIAEALFDALCERLPEGAKIYLDVPEPNRAALDIATRRGMQPAFETARMYAGGRAELPLQHIFGITSFELG